MHPETRRLLIGDNVRQLLADHAPALLVFPSSLITGMTRDDTLIHILGDSKSVAQAKSKLQEKCRRIREESEICSPVMGLLKTHMDHLKDISDRVQEETSTMAKEIRSLQKSLVKKGEELKQLEEEMASKQAREESRKNKSKEKSTINDCYA